MAMICPSKRVFNGVLGCPQPGWFFSPPPQWFLTLGRCNDDTLMADRLPLLTILSLQTDVADVLKLSKLRCTIYGSVTWTKSQLQRKIRNFRYGGYRAKIVNGLYYALSLSLSPNIFFFLYIYISLCIYICISLQPSLHSCFSFPSTLLFFLIHTNYFNRCIADIAITVMNGANHLLSLLIIFLTMCRICGYFWHTSLWW